MKIVIDSGIPFIQGTFEGVFNVIYMPGNLIKNEDLVDVDALVIRTRTRCNRELLEGTSVKIICSATIGYDHLDTLYCEERGIEWHTVPGCNASSVAQYVLSALALNHTRKPNPFSQLTVGVIGYGNVGKVVVKYLNALGIKTIINDPVLQELDSSFHSHSLDILLAESDIITIHTPLTYTGNHPTYHLINKNFLFRLKPNALLMNSSRGEVVDESVLVKMVLENKVGSVVLDVWENEPSINQSLLNRVLIGTPHIAGYSADGKYNGTIGCIEQICNFFNIPSLKYKATQPSPPSDRIIEVDVNNRSFEDVFAQVIGSTYQVNRDSQQLKENSKNFEFLRNSYPNRREFDAYSVRFIGTPSFDVTPFFTLGFNPY